jgi:hypothetical protein
VPVLIHGRASRRYGPQKAATSHLGPSITATWATKQGSPWCPGAAFLLKLSSALTIEPNRWSDSAPAISSSYRQPDFSGTSLLPGSSFRLLSPCYYGFDLIVGGNSKCSWVWFTTVQVCDDFGSISCPWINNPGKELNL